MLSLKDLECLTALTRHMHFARAAEAVGMSQPAFSMRIRRMEERVGAPIVNRGNRFHGLTPEGEAMVADARDILDRVRALEDRLKAGEGNVSGTLRIGSVPTASAYAALAAGRLRARHPGARVRIDTATSLAVQQGVDEGLFDIGLTYSEGVSADLLKVEELYREAYVLLAPDVMLQGSETSMAWAEAAALPLILLEPEMQNRRFLDDTFQSVGAAPTVIAETGGFVAALTLAVQGIGATVLPRVLVETLGALQGTRVLSLTDPVVEKPMALVTPRRGSVQPVVEAFRQAAYDSLPLSPVPQT